jgi:murein DD-endopeptidase MepM/ murein hydrolase activator NlpD
MGFAKGLRVGKQVDQRDIIGYVGKTGNASGYHLHYEVRLSGRAVNPQTLKLPARGPVPEDLRPNFEYRRDSLFEMLQPVYGPPLAAIG